MSNVATYGEGNDEWWMVNGESETIWNGTVLVQIEVQSRDWEEQRNPLVTIAGLWVWAWGLLNTKNDFWPIDCDHWFVGLRIELRYEREGVLLTKNCSVSLLRHSRVVQVFCPSRLLCRIYGLSEWFLVFLANKPMLWLLPGSSHSDASSEQQHVDQNRLSQSLKRQSFIID